MLKLYLRPLGGLGQNVQWYLLSYGNSSDISIRFDEKNESSDVTIEYYLPQCVSL